MAIKFVGFLSGSLRPQAGGFFLDRSVKRAATATINIWQEAVGQQLSFPYFFLILSSKI
jgi:hypothetical protein